ncbi:MAG: IS66 family transposase [Halofilum sp. (in: g-proteobacteria)]|nr:IS66 family transposase [Halofilum sp. (in: g-proteobacteria)]
MHTASTSVTPASPSYDEVLADNAMLREQLAGSLQRTEELERQLAWMKRQVFGPRSERRHLDGEGAIADLFAGDVPEKPKAPEKQKISYERDAPGSNKERGDAVTEEGLRFDADVPVETIDVRAPELEGADADAWEIIDYRTTHRLAQRPGSQVVLAYRRPVLRHRDEHTVTAPPAPANVLEGSCADVSVLAGLIVDKFCYHCPLYRQHQRLTDAGIHLSRATLTNWTNRTAELLAPIAAAQHAHILDSAVLAMDETPIKAGRNAAKGKMKQGWYWPIFGDAGEISFTFSPGRAARHVHEQLAGFTGTLITDGYGAYRRFAKATGGVTHAQCWAHTRRQFIEAEKSEPDGTATALEYIRVLYEHEAAIRDRRLEPDKALAYRAEHSRAVVDAFFAWVHEQRQDPGRLPSDPFTKALAYAHEREGPLRVFLSDPAVAIDTNHLERALRVIPMGRKNWHFCWSEAGARHVGTIQSLLTTCRLQGINPYTYLVDVLQRIAEHPASDVIALTPRVWKERFADAPLGSDVLRHGA